MTESRFDQASTSWDEEPARVAMAQNIANAIKTVLPIQPSFSALDFGCGTGLVTIALQPYFNQITGIDSSPGMLEKLQQKIATYNIKNIKTQLIDLTSEKAPINLRANVIFSAMALHHIADITALLQKFATMLPEGGMLALADLDSEDGSFHLDQREVHHHGIEREYLKVQLSAIGIPTTN